MSGGFQIVGRWKTELFDKDGKLKDVQQGPNIVCTNGKEFLASFLNSAVAAAATFTVKYIGIGTDATAETAANTTLGVELSRQTGTASYISNQIFQVKATFAAGSGTGAIVEYGLFSSSANGTMLARYTKSVINKAAGDTLAVTAQITLS